MLFFIPFAFLASQGLAKPIADAFVETRQSGTLSSPTDSSSTTQSSSVGTALASITAANSTVNTTLTSPRTLTYTVGTGSKASFRTVVIRHNTTLFSVNETTPTQPTISGYVTISATPVCSSVISALECTPTASSTPLTSAFASSSPSTRPVFTSISNRFTASTTMATPPAPTGSGTVSRCTEWYIAIPGDFCYTVAEKASISTAKFMHWNPSVGSECNTMLAGHAYCIATWEPAPTLTSTCISVLTNSSSTSLSSSASVTSSTSSSSTINRSTSQSNTTSNTPSSTLGPLDVYRTYLGDGSEADGWPSMSQWTNFTYMFAQNTPHMKSSCSNNWNVPDDTDTEIAEMRDTILSVGADTGMDPRFILAIIMQESSGCVRVITTSYSHANPGLMQSFNGTGTCNPNNAEADLPGVTSTGVQTPCPASEIRQQILDGTNGTVWGPGLVQDMQQQGHTDVSGYYRTARLYNGGSLEADGNLIGPCCTASYASDVANRLTGWVKAERNFTG